MSGDWPCPALNSPSALLVATLVVAAFFGGIMFERERQGEDEKAAALAAKYPVHPIPIIRGERFRLRGAALFREPLTDVSCSSA